jgi:hypothetical protein
MAVSGLHISYAGIAHVRLSGLVTGLVAAPFIINNFVAAEIAQRVLPNWWVVSLLLHRIRY